MKIKARVRREGGCQRSVDGDRSSDGGVRTEAEGLYRVRHVKSGLYVTGGATTCGRCARAFLRPWPAAGVPAEKSKRDLPANVQPIGGSDRTKKAICTLGIPSLFFVDETGVPVMKSMLLALDRKECGLVFPRRKAACVADAWIAVTGDAGVEIEPVEA